MSVICSSSSRLSSYRISSHGLKPDSWIQSTARGGGHEGTSLQTPLRAGGGASEEVLSGVGRRAGDVGWTAATHPHPVYRGERQAGESGGTERLCSAGVVPFGLRWAFVSSLQRVDFV